MHFTSSLTLAAAFAVSAQAYGNAHHHKRQAYGAYGPLNSTSSASPISYEPASTGSSSAVVAPVNSAPAPMGTGAYSSSIVVPLSTGASASGAAPYPTGGVGAAAAFASGSVTSSSAFPTVTGYETSIAYTTVTSDTTLTYTLGSGSSKSIVTTTIHHTSTEYETMTYYVQASATSSVAAGASASAGSDSGSDSGSTSTGTTTLRSTSTITNYVTVFPESTGSVGANAQYASASSAGADGLCAAPVTVTVTAQETVYLTLDSAASTIAVSTGAKNVLPIQSSSSAYYPTANGAAAANATVASTGFQTLQKPTGTGVYSWKPTGY